MGKKGRERFEQTGQVFRNGGLMDVSKARNVSDVERDRMRKMGYNVLGSVKTWFTPLFSDTIELCEEENDLACDTRDDLVIHTCRRSSRMTLALAFVGKGGIVMATDSAEAYFGDSGKLMRIELSQKLYKLGKHTGLAIVSQQAGLSEWMVHRFNTTILEHNKGLAYDDMVNMFTQYVREYWDVYTKNMPASLLRDKASQISFILCGYNAKDKPSIMRSVSVSTPSIFAPYAFSRYCALGCFDEAEYWIGKIRSHIGIDEMSIDILKRLCIYLIRETAERYPELVQEPVQMLTITKGDGVALVAKKEIATLSKSIRTLSSQNRIIKMLMGAED